MTSEERKQRLTFEMEHAPYLGVSQLRELVFELLDRIDALEQYREKSEPSPIPCPSHRLSLEGGTIGWVLRCDTCGKGMELIVEDGHIVGHPR